MTDTTSAVIQPYKIVSVEEAEAPTGADGADWHCYVIAQGSNTINGYRQGNVKSVTAAVEEIVAQLNERQLGKRGRVNLVPTPKKNQAK